MKTEYLIIIAGGDNSRVSFSQKGNQPVLPRYCQTAKKTQTSSWRATALAVLAGFGLNCISSVAAQEAAKDESPIPAEVLELTATFNDDVIPFNNKLVMLGKADAPVAAVLVFGLSEDTTYMVGRWLPDIVDKYVESGKMKLTVIDFPLTWHDMQAFAAFRCVAPEKHWELLKDAVKYPRPAYNMKNDSLLNAPDHVWGMMKSHGVPRDRADKCMRNNAIVGHIEAQRLIVTDTWKTTVAPTFIVGNKVIVNPSSPSAIEDAIEAVLKGGK